MLIHNPGTAGDVAIFSGLGDGEAHAGDTGFIHEIADELQLMETLEIGHLWLITRFNEGLEAGLNKSARATAEDGLFAKEIGLSFFLEGGLEHAGAGRADALSPSERDFLSGLRLILGDGDECWHAFTFGVEAADHVARALGSDHNAVDVLVQLDQAEVNGETVAEEKGFTLGEMGEDGARVDVSLFHVGQADHDNIGAANGFAGLDDLEAMGLSDGFRFGSSVKANDDLAAAVLQIERMGVALRTIAEDGERFILKHAEIGVFVGVDFSGHDERGMRIGLRKRGQI